MLRRSVTARSRRHFSRVVNLILVIASSLVGGLTVEGAYRYYLYASEPYHFLGDRNVWYFQASPYRYSEEFGYEYVPGSYPGGAAYDGQVTACWDRPEEWQFNELGNSGRIKGSYKDSNLKILAFGDSFTQRTRKTANDEYVAWPDFLQDKLEQELATSVNVVNFGRDAYGVLQMFDLAAAKMREWKPDLAIIAFITDDLTRSRFWRTTTFLDGRQRIITSTVPTPDPTWDTSTDAYLLQPNATSKWCHEALESKILDDPIVLELEEALRQGRRRSTLLADPFSLWQSFVWDRIVRKDPYHSTYSQASPAQMPRHALTGFAQDERFVRKVAELRQLGIPYVLVHLATSREISKGEEFAAIRSERERALVDDLARLTRQPIRGTIEHTDLPVKDLERVPKSANDQHPSLRGHEFYAETILNILRRNGYLQAARQQVRGTQ